MVDLADIKPDHRVLEPSAGTGRLLDPLYDEEGSACAASELVAVELNQELARRLTRTYVNASVRNADFLQCNGDLGTFDRIVMNPPFANADDIKHIKHAVGMLKPGGKLVAICANGPRQRNALQPVASYWEDLPAGTFAEQGTNVNTALLVIER